MEQVNTGRVVNTPAKGAESSDARTPEEVEEARILDLFCAAGNLAVADIFRDDTIAELGITDRINR